MHRVERSNALIAGPTAPGRGQSFDSIEISIGNRGVEARFVVRRRTEDVEGFGEAQSPGVVGRRGDELEVTPVGPEPEQSLAELHRLPVHLPFESGVADRAPDVVVRGVLQVRRPRVRVTNAPTRTQHLTHVGFVVAVRVLQKQDVRRLRHDDATIGECQARGNVEPIGEDRELVRPTIAVRIFENLDAVVARLAVQNLVGIIDGFDQPESSALVEIEGNRFNDVRFTGEELDGEFRRNLDELHRLLHAQRQLITGSRIAGLVIGNGKSVDIDDIRHLQLFPGGSRRLGNRSDNPFFNPRMEGGRGPRCRIRIGRCIENRPLE